MNKPQIGKKNTIYYINTILVLLLMFGFGYLPPFGTVTQLGMQVIGVLLGMFYGWSFIEMIWPSVLGLLALAYWNIDSLVQLNTDSFGNNVVVMIFFLFAFAYYLDVSGLTKHIAEWFISRKIAIGRPYVLTYLIYLCCLILTGMLTTPYPSMLFCWGIIYGICESAGYPKKSPVATMMMGGVTIAGGYGAIFFPWAVMAVAYLGALDNSMGVSVNFIVAFLTFASFGLVVLALYNLVCKYCFKIDLSALAEGGDRYSHLRHNKMDKTQKFAAIIMVFFVGAIILMSMLPKTLPVIGLLNNWGVTGIAMAVLAIMGIFRNINGEAVFNVQEFFTKGVQWPIVLMLASMMPTSTLLESEEAGVMDWIVAQAVPALSSLSPLLCITLVVVFLTVLTQVCHNLVLGLVFIPIFGPILAELGINPVVFGLALSMGLQTAFVSPASAGQTAMLYANTEWVTTKDVYKFMITGFLLGTAVLVIVYIPILMALFN